MNKLNYILITICVISISCCVVLFMKYRTLQQAINKPAVTQKPSITITSTLKTTKNTQNKPTSPLPGKIGIAYGRSYQGNNNTYTQSQVDEIIASCEERLAGMGTTEQTTRIEYIGGTESVPVVPAIQPAQAGTKDKQVVVGVLRGKIIAGAGLYLYRDFGLLGVVTRDGDIGANLIYRW